MIDGAFHTLRIGLDSGGLAHAWLDGAEATYTPSASGSDQTIFGDSSSTIDSATVLFDYARWNTSFVPLVGSPSLLELQVNTTTGLTTLKNDTGASIDINSYQISSANDPGLLNPSGWTSFENPSSASGFPSGDGTGNGWEEGDGSNPNLLIESYLQGFSTVVDTASISLGSAFDPSVLGSGVDGDLVFEYHVPGAPSSTVGVVSYVTSPAVDGDYNSDGIVNAADYTLWRDNLGAGDESGINFNGDGGGVTALDYTFWKSKFGNTSGSGSLATAEVPEPSSLVLIAMAMTGVVGMILIRTRRRMNLKQSAFVALLVVAAASNAGAATLDRNYRLGDGGDSPAASDGSPVGITFDDQGVTGMNQLIDLAGVNDPVYRTITGRPDGVGGLGIEFNGASSQYLRGLQLGLPSTSVSALGSGFGTLNYNGINDRGFQFWVQPAASGAQSLVMDTNQHGARINASGNFSMRYAGTDFDTTIAATSGTWYHVMVVRPEGAANGARMYVDGIAVSAAPGGYAGGDTADLVVGSNTGGDDFDFTGGTEEFFTGIIDDLTMFVIGDNSGNAGPPQGQDWGAFDFGVDNAFAATALAGLAAGDLTGDGSVTGDGSGSVATDDVAAFVANWEFEQSFNGVRAGDINTRMLGDFDFDGFVGLADWHILRTNHVNAASLDLGALLTGTSVPEPAGFSLLLIALTSAGAARWFRQRCDE